MGSQLPLGWPQQPGSASPCAPRWTCGGRQLSGWQCCRQLVPLLLVPLSAVLASLML